MSLSNWSNLNLLEDGFKFFGWVCLLELMLNSLEKNSSDNSSKESTVSAGFINDLNCCSIVIWGSKFWFPIDAVAASLFCAGAKIPYLSECNKEALAEDPDI